MAQSDKKLSFTSFTGRKKAAIFLVTIGSELSANILKHLKPKDVEELTLEIARLDRIEPEDRESVLHEFNDLLSAQEYILQGGIDYARQVLEKALGPEKAAEIIHRLTSSIQVRPFDFIKKADPGHILNFIQNEHPQTIALILSYIDSAISSQILTQLPPAVQADVAKRIATMDRTSPEVLRDVERVLEKKLSALVSAEYTSTDGVQTVVEMLNRVDRTTEKTILEMLEQSDPELVEEIKRRLFVFEDIVLLSDRDVQKVLREVDTKDLALALKGVDDYVGDKIYNNMSKRAASLLKEEIEYMGPVRVRDVEEAQQRIVNTIRKMEEQGEVIIARGGTEEIIT